MNELASYQPQQLPDTLEDLTKFVLVGRAALDAYKAKLRTVNRLSLAQEIREQTLKEAQDVNSALMAAEVRIGELLLAIPSASGHRTDLETSSERVEKVKTKSETVKEMGYSKDETSDYQRMAQNPEVVRRVLDEAIANGEIATRSQVMKEIAEAKKLQQEENDRLRSALSEAEARRIADKNRSREVEAWKKDLQREQEKVAAKSREILELKDKIRELEFSTKEGLDTANLSENVFYFCTIANNFIGNVGGLVWLTDRIADMPAKEKDMFLKAAYSFRDWALVFADNLERSVNSGKYGTAADTGVPLLADKE